MMFVQDLLHATARRLPDKIAVICEGHRLTYADLEGRSNRLANGLRSQGLKRGDRVALFLPNCLSMVVSIFGVLKAGGTFVPINYSTKREKLLQMLAHCQTKAFITDARGAASSCASRMQIDAPSVEIVLVDSRDANGATGTETACLDLERLMNASSAESPTRDTIDRDLACLLYTSGSTGNPKGVMCDHSNVVFATQSVSAYLENSAEEVFLNVLPLSFGYGLYQLFMACHCGGTLVLEKSFAFPTRVMESIQRERVTAFAGVPAIFVILLQMDLSSYDLSSLRYLTNAAAPLAPSQIAEVRRRFENVRFFSMYGLTETKRALYLPPDQLDKRPSSVGIAIPNTEVWIEDALGRRLGPGEIGELVVRGRHVMRGYWGSPEETARRFKAGPVDGERICYTGDLFRMDEEGYFYFVSRQDDIIKSGGQKIAPKEVENVLYQLQGVAEAAVIGTPDPMLGEAIKAFIVTNGVSLSHAQVLAHCRSHLEDYMIPKRIEFRDQLPKTASGKINKNDLRQENVNLS